MSRDQVEENGEIVELVDAAAVVAGDETDDLERDPASEPPELVGPEEIVDGVPVLAEVRAIEVSRSGSLPAVQTAVAVATGFVAGAATLALVRRHSSRRLDRARGRSRRGSEGLSIVGSRSFLVDVHLIAKPGE